MYSLALSRSTCFVLACPTSRAAAWGVTAGEKAAGRWDNRSGSSTGGWWSSTGSWWNVGSSSWSRSRPFGASRRALASEAWRWRTSRAQLQLPSSRGATTAVPSLPPPPVTITTASTEASWLGSANPRRRAGQAHFVSLASMVSRLPCSRRRPSRGKATPVRASALQPGFREQLCHPRGPCSGLCVASGWVGGPGVSGVGHVGRKSTVASGAPESIGGGVGGSINTISSSSSGGVSGGGGGGSRDSGDSRVEVTENVMVRKGRKSGAPAGAAADSVAAGAAAKAPEVGLEDVPEPALKSAAKRRKVVPSSPGGTRKGAERVSPKAEDVPGEKEGEEEASAEAGSQEKQKPKEPAKTQTPTNPSKGRGRAKPSAAKVESGDEGGEGETVPAAEASKRAGKASPGGARRSSAAQQAAATTEAEDKEGGCDEGEPASPVKGKRSSGKASARGGGSSAKQLLAAAKEAEAQAGRSKEPWSVLVHRKRQPGWVAYDPRTMRPDLAQLLEPSAAAAAAAAAAGAAAAAAGAGPSAAGEAVGEVGAEAADASAAARPADASAAARPADASAAAGGAAAREDSEALGLRGRKVWRLLLWNVNGLRALLKAKEAGGSETNGTPKAKKRKQGKGTEDAEEVVEEEEKEGVTSGSKGEGEGKGVEGKGVKQKVSKEAAEEAHVLAALMATENADVLCLQETKLQEKDCEELEVSLKAEGFASHCVWSCSHAKLGYSGTAIISRHKPLSVRCGLGDNKHDGEGRVITAEFPTFYLVNAYVPNSGDQLKRLEYRTKEWDPALAQHIKELEKRKPAILTGDLNCAHEEIDIFHPDGNKRSAGFTVEERESFERCFLEHPDGPLIDTFRAQHPHAVAYTYWGYRSRARPENRGWRLDYFLASQSLKPQLLDSYTLPHVGGSDHCPLGLILTEP